MQGANQYVIELADNPLYSNKKTLPSLRFAYNAGGSTTTDFFDLRDEFPNVAEGDVIFFRIGARNVTDNPGPLPNGAPNGGSWIYSANDSSFRVIGTPPPPPCAVGNPGGERFCFPAPMPRRFPYFASSVSCLRCLSCGLLHRGGDAMRMTFQRATATALLALLAVVLSFARPLAAQGTASLAVPGEIVLKAPAGTTAAQVQAMADAADCRVVGPIVFSPDYFFWSSRPGPPGPPGGRAPLRRRPPPLMSRRRWPSWRRSPASLPAKTGSRASSRRRRTPPLPPTTRSTPSSGTCG